MNRGLAEVFGAATLRLMTTSSLAGGLPGSSNNTSGQCHINKLTDKLSKLDKQVRGGHDADPVPCLHPRHAGHGAQGRVLQIYPGRPA